MKPLRILALCFSAAAHGAAGWYAFTPDSGNAYALGTGDDQFVIEQGISIEGAALFGEDTETIQAVEAEPAELSEARPEVQEVKPEELIEDTKVLTSEAGPVQDLPPEEVKTVETPVEQQVATIEQEQVVPVEAKQAAGAVKTGGDASAKRVYEGKLHNHIMKKIVRPKAGERTGQVLVRFTIDPSGEVVSREVAKSSGFKNIDEAALATIDRASPFPPVPAELASGPQVHTVPFKYRVE
ncbi:MAG: TonB family protein [Hyphomicrobium sp.]